MVLTGVESMTKTHFGPLIWLAAVLLGTAMAVILKRLGVIGAFAEASGLSVGAMIGWLWARQFMTTPSAADPGGAGPTRTFWDWTAWWVAGAFVIAALRVQGLFW